MKCPNCEWQDRGNERLEEINRLLLHSAKYRDQTEGRTAISGLTHALRCASVCKAMGFDEELQFIALVHDLARPLNDVHHGEIMAEMVRDRVSNEAYEVLKTHGQFQASIVHNTAAPTLSSIKAQGMAEFIAWSELQSFNEEFEYPVMKLMEAKDLLVKFLG